MMCILEIARLKLKFWTWAKIQSGFLIIRIEHTSLFSSWIKTRKNLSKSGIDFNSEHISSFLHMLAKTLSAFGFIGVVFNLWKII